MASKKINAEALEYYNNSPQIKAQVARIFNSMDMNGDGTITKKEFSNFLQQRKFLSKWMEHDSMFADLDKDNSGELDFDEIIAFVHKVFTWFVCDGCGQQFDKGNPHLTCAKCFRRGHRSFDICSSCHLSNKYKHIHNDFREFGPLVSQCVARTEMVKYGLVFKTYSNIVDAVWNIQGAIQTASTGVVPIPSGVIPGANGTLPLVNDPAQIGADPVAIPVDPAVIGVETVGIPVDSSTIGVEPVGIPVDPAVISGESTSVAVETALTDVEATAVGGEITSTLVETIEGGVAVIAEVCSIM